MTDLKDKVTAAASKGELEPWKAALLKLWLGDHSDADAQGPSTEDLAKLLTDPQRLAQLKATVDGPWDVLAAQARSLVSHDHVGDALDALARE